MNLKNQSFQGCNSYSDFYKDILNPFLDESGKYYPNIIESNSDGINMTLLKMFPESRYSFEYEESISLIFNFLKDLIAKYGLDEIYFVEHLEYGFCPSIKIKVLESISSKKRAYYYDEIFRQVVDFAESNNIEFILDDLSIILCR